MDAQIIEAINDAVKVALESAAKDSWESILVAIGIIVAIAAASLFFWGYVRTNESTIKRLSERITALADFQSTTLLDVVKNNAITMCNVSDVLRDNTEAINGLRDHLAQADRDLRDLMVEVRQRPCIAKETA
jgi:methyl-accepting chemotaxis protein